LEPWCGHLVLKCLSPKGISWEYLPWLQPDEATQLEQQWVYKFYVQGTGSPEWEIAKTIQALLKLLVLEDYSLVELSATFELLEGPYELRAPRIFQH